MDIFNRTKNNRNDFQDHAISLFKTQANEVELYKQFIENLNIDPNKVSKLNEIPFLPVEFFKSHSIYRGANKPEILFKSSSTTGTGQSTHAVADLKLYEQSFINAFRHFYGDPADFCFLFLLPSYLEREGSSLIYMAESMIQMSRYSESGFYLNNIDDLHKQLIVNEQNSIPTILMGVSFALLDFAEQFSMQLKSTIVMETGGMKGRRAEVPREELHTILCKSLGVSHIHSEYGMTELLSQAYSKGNGVFETPPWMQVSLYDPYNPLKPSENNTGGVNIIDLANQFSCAFIQTNDIGKKNGANSFEILGRFDYSDVRGCNLLVY
ncbi:MAG: acyltransferase [Salinivirgaceae bacterium]|nr:acyltransferase [Salinivirgaceae bacterium]MDD4745911.1 acyltransferase [Salinivirgaceae bacterium]MDY0281039.1 acyltransferase [Salinivirgaceae bacterium]